MSILVVVIHVIVCFALILIVLLQTGKGADMGAAFGGGASQTLFGTTGASTFLSKATTTAAIVFMLTSLALAYMSSDRETSRLVNEPPPAQTQTAPPSAPPDVQDQAPAAPSEPEGQPAQENAPAKPPADEATPSSEPDKTKP